METALCGGALGIWCLGEQETLAMLLLTFKEPAPVPSANPFGALQVALCPVSI